MNEFCNPVNPFETTAMNVLNLPEGKSMRNLGAESHMAEVIISSDGRVLKNRFCDNVYLAPKPTVKSILSDVRTLITDRFARKQNHGYA